MWPYWFLFMLPLVLAISQPKPVALPTPGQRWPNSWIAMYLVLVLAIGLRHEVGGDWINYLDHLNSVTYATLADALQQSDPAYALLNWLAARSGLDVYFVNSVCAALFGWGLVSFCRIQPRPWLALVVAFPYLIMVVAMGYTRQGVAIGLAMLGLVALTHKRVLRFLLCFSVAALFHKSAVILLPIVALASSRRRVFTLLWAAAGAFTLYVLLLQDSVDDLTINYIEAQYQSSGAAIRIAMNALPAAVFLLLRKRFDLAPAQRSFWTWMAVSGLAFVVLLKVSPSSTAVDRVALYWIPLQLFVWSRLPGALGRRGGANRDWVYAVVAYSAAVQFVWLFFADFSSAWLPYQFYPWVWFWH